MIKISNNIAIIEFFNEKANSLSTELLNKLINAFKKVSHDKAVRTVILKSGGTGAFCAGASLNELKNLNSTKEAVDFFALFGKLILSMIECKKPIITQVHGPTVGGGVGILAASDYTIASTKASVRLSELAIGLGAFVIEPVITHKIGHAHFNNLALDCTERDLDWCLSCGLISQKSDDLIDSTNELVERVKNYNLDSFWELKSLNWKRLDYAKILQKRAKLSAKFTRKASL